MKRLILPLIFVGAIGAGCASHQHAYYSPPPPPAPVVVPGPVVIMPAPIPPPATVVVPAVNEGQAIQIARSEAFRHGWRNTKVQRAGYWNDRWHVDLYNEPHHHVEHYGWAEIAPDGAVLAFSDTPRHHAYWEGHQYREYRY